MLKSLFSGLALCLWASQLVAAEINTIDLAGREIKIEGSVERFGVSEGRYLTVLSLLRPENPVKGVVGMMTTLGWTHPELEQKLYARFPEAKNIPTFGMQSADSVSIEKIIELKAQVAFLGLSDHGPNSKAKELIDLLEASGTKVVFIDFRLDPLKNTIPSLKLMGEILGEQENAQRYIDLYQQKLDLVKSRVAKIKDKPSVFLQVHAGRRECCWGMAEGMLGPFVGEAGGVNIADAVAPGPTALHTAEFLLVENPDVWIGTASGWKQEYDGGALPVTVGPGMSDEMAEGSLGKYLKTTDFQAIDAVKNDRSHAFWHNFYNSPFNIVVLEAFAKWLHPEEFKDIDPDASLRQIYKDFMPFEIDGTYFTTYHHE
ncbi:ABC transporter substrate-binding protein [Curvivirga sp.]|uniref:ABC transporter substrate-binding protein n=1 Tax=Curvivirga sp. TaxID=2856848 RepID=UPI003B5C2CD3